MPKTKPTKIITVANRLPVTISDTIRKSPGGLVSALDGVKEEFQLHWIGWPGIVTDNPKRQKEIRHQLSKYDFSPVFLSENEVDDYYQGYSNSALWPAFHYFPHYVRVEDNWWKSYQEVNRKFAERIIKEAQPEDLIWVHDYHLMLVPGYVKKVRPELKIGFFLHTPFPSYEIFRCLPHRKEILEGVIRADLIGFHTYGYLRHFRSSLIRLLNIEAEMDGFGLDNKRTSMGVFPIGINAKSFVEGIKTPECKKHLKQLKQTYKGRKIVLSVERLDYTKGVIRRLRAIEKFLQRRPKHDDVVFIFISVPSRDVVKEYTQLREDISSMIGRINGAFSDIHHTPIHFIHRSVEFSELCALYSAASVAFVTPLIDGMNLVAKEYLACHKDGKGSLILSEFAGAAHELYDAIIVNPYDIESMVSGLERAVDTESHDQHRSSIMRQHILEYDSQNWARAFIRSLVHTPDYRSPSSQTNESLKRMVQSVRKAKSAAVFLDYDGTLREFERYPRHAKPTQDILKLLKKLASKFDVYILSGRKSEDLQEWMGQLPITLISEHGYQIRFAGHEKWKRMQKSLNLSWKQQILEILERYVATTPGSFIEDKNCAIVWHYKRSDPEFGAWKSQLLLGMLSEMTGNLPVEVHQGHFTIQISAVQVSKGAAIQQCLSKKNYDMILCAGDDQTDENMFRVDHPALQSIKVGDGETAAAFQVKDPSALRSLLNKLAAPAK